MQSGSVKNGAAINTLPDMRGVDERGAAAACMVASDEETHRCMHHFI